jgi:phosphoribosylformimino-5-aminoimidazole carboxamide ribonucleotide (ProFAR) isomerase
MDLYPAIDIRRGASVRLVQGDFERETVYGDPVETACSYLSKGARRLHVVDLEAAAGNLGANRGMVSRIVSVAADHSALVQVGGGVRDEAAVEELLAVGAWRIVIGTAALSDPEMVTHIAATYPGRIVVGLDYRMASNRRSEGGQGDAGNPSDLVASMMLATEGSGWAHIDGGRAGLVRGLWRRRGRGHRHREGRHPRRSQLEWAAGASGGNRD